nr:dynein axonemal light chain 1-like [Cherax quadricarinatus]
MRQWEENTGEKASDAVEVKLIGLYPPIEKLDSSLQALVNCEKLSLSTNMIEKLSHLNNLRCLKILSLGRNNIKNFTGLVSSTSCSGNSSTSALEICRTKTIEDSKLNADHYLTQCCTYLNFRADPIH